MGLATSAALLAATTIVHVLAGAIFAIGALVSLLFTLQVPNTPTLVAKARVMGRNSLIVRAMILPGVLLAGVTGVGLVWEQGRTLHERWLLYAIILYAIAFIVGAATGPITSRLRRNVEQEARSGKRPSVEVIRALRSPLSAILATVNVVIVIALVYLMFAKPGNP
jgi:uncharacterized membrane protein